MSSVSLQDCFELFTQEETLEGDERPVSLILMHICRMISKHLCVLHGFLWAAVIYSSYTLSYLTCMF